MYLIKTNKPRNPFSILILFIVFFIFGVSNIIAQQTVTIDTIKFKRQTVEQVTIITTKPKGKPESTIIHVNDPFPSGTIFEIPAKTEVFIKSNHNNRVRLGPGSKHMSSPGPKGEKHKTFKAKVGHFVNTKLKNGYKGSGPTTRSQGAASSTEFTVEVVGKEVKYETIKGSIQIQREVKVNISEQSKINRKKDRELITIKTSDLYEGAPEQTFRYDIMEEVTYPTYREAINELSDQLQKEYESGADAEYLVEEYTLLGELYLDMGEPVNALDQFTDALDLYKNEIDPNDPLIAEIYLNLAEANLLAGYQQEGNSNWKTAEKIIIKDLNYNVEDFNYFKSTQDTEMIWSIGMDLVDNYNNLGWGYDVVGNYDKADYYYKLADKLENDLAAY